MNLTEKWTVIVCGNSQARTKPSIHCSSVLSSSWRKWAYRKCRGAPDLHSIARKTNALWFLLLGSNWLLPSFTAFIPSHSHHYQDSFKSVVLSSPHVYTWLHQAPCSWVQPFFTQEISIPLPISDIYAIQCREVAYTWTSEDPVQFSFHLHMSICSSQSYLLCLCCSSSLPGHQHDAC